MVIDSLGQVPEFNEGDNAYPQTFYWNEPGKANLVVPQPLSVSNLTPSLGDTVAVSLIVRNIGNAAASNFQVGLYFNRSTPPTTNDAPNMAQTVTSTLSPGGETTVTFSVSNATQDLWQTYALVDASGAIDESIENDNAAGPRTISWTAGVVTVRGTFAYDDSVHGGAQTYTPCAVVEVWHDDVVDSLLATGVLATDGTYQIGPITNVDATPDPGNARLNVYVRWKYESRERCWNSSYPDTPIVRMKVGDDENRWSFRTPTIPHIPNMTYNFGLQKPTRYDQRSAAHIFDVIQRTWRWFGNDYRSLYGSPGPVNVRWLPGFTTQAEKYVPADSTIYIDGRYNAALGYPDEWDDFAILHEYGHHVNWTLGGVSYSLTDSSGEHSWSGPCRSLRSAWDEGVADLVGCGFRLSQGAIYDDFGRDPDGTIRHVTHVNLESGQVLYITDGIPGLIQDRNAAGPANELCIASMLWDVQDNVPDNPNGDAFGDSLWGGWGTIFEEICHYRAGQLHTVYDFNIAYTQLWCSDPDYRLDAQFVFYEHGLFSDINGVTTDVTISDVSRNLALYGGTPNPFNPRTRIRFELPASDLPHEFVIQVFDAGGSLVRKLDRGVRGQGLYTSDWDGTNDMGASVASGVYFVHLTWGEQQRTRRVTLLR
jgi:CARDB protein/flagellar hook capping protein FlgD